MVNIKFDIQLFAVPTGLSFAGNTSGTATVEDLGASTGSKYVYIYVENGVVGKTEIIDTAKGTWQTANPTKTLIGAVTGNASAGSSTFAFETSIASAALATFTAVLTPPAANVPIEADVVYKAGSAKFTASDTGTGTLASAAGNIISVATTTSLVVTSGQLSVDTSTMPAGITAVASGTSVILATTAATNVIVNVIGKNASGTQITATVTDTTAGTIVYSDGSVSDLTSGTVNYANLKGTETLTVKDTSFKVGAAGTFNVATYNGVTNGVGVVTGTISLASTDAGTKYYGVSGVNTLVADVTYNSSAGNGVDVGFSSGKPTVDVSTLDQIGESVTVGNYKYELISTGIIKQTDGSNNETYWSATGADCDNDGISAASPIRTAPILVTNASGTTKYYNAVGIEVKSDSNDIAATVVGTSTPYSVTIDKKIGTGVNLTGATATVKDGGTETVYTRTGANAFTATGATFTSTNGVISNATKTLVLTSGSTMEAVGNVNVDASMTSSLAGTGTSITGAIVTYDAGSALNNATVKLSNTVTVKVTEDSNTTNTVINGNGNIEGIDGNATLTGVNATSTVATTGNGAVSVNGVIYNVADDADGVTFTAAASGASHIARLDKDATVTISSKLSDASLSFGNSAGTEGTNLTSFSALKAANGATFTSNATNGTASITLNAGDAVTVGGLVYTINTSSDGVTITNGALSNLTNGDKVVVTSATSNNTLTYTVSEGVLEIEKYNATTQTTSTEVYTISDSTEPFGVNTVAVAGLTSVVTNGAQDQNINGVLNANGGAAINSAAGTVYITQDGTVSLSSEKAAATVTTSDSGVVTYDTLTEKAQTVNVTGDTKAKDSWVINTKSGKDTITYAATADATIASGEGNDTITASGAGDKVINAGNGKDTVNFTGGAGSATVNAGSGDDDINVTVAGKGDVVINGESGNNDISVTGTGVGTASIVGGTGKDTITARADDVVSGGDGADTFNVSTSSMTISDYTYGTDVMQAVNTSGTVAVNPTNFGADGVVSIASGVTADVSAGTGTGEFYAVSLVDKDGKNKQNVAWAKEGGSTIDITTYDQAVTLIGDTDGKNALYAGTKADNIYSYADSDSVYGGAGKDVISLATVASGRVVGVATTSGKDTVSGFKASFEEGDSIYMVDGSASDVKVSFANNNVTFKDGEGSLQLNGIATNSTTGAVELNVSGAKVALAAASVGGAIAADSTSYANFYMGNGAGVSFAAAEGEVNVDLRNGLDSGAEGAKFSGITAVTGGAGNNTLIGSTAADSIYAGTGTSSLWGGAGKDTLVGSTASDAFFIGAGDGSDVVTNFSAAGNENADTVYALNDITGAKLTSNGVEISVGDTDKLTLRNVTADTAIKFNSNGNAGVAKVGSATTANNFSYDSTVTYYGGGNKSDKIAFASGSTENAEIWLDGSQGKAYASINVVDGTNTSGNLLVAGDSSSQSIIGGKGDTSLWGGAGSVSDTLKSSSGSKTMFWWGAGEGNDLVVSASADDSVNLYNLKLSDVDAANSSITNSGVVLALNDGSKLTVQSSRDVTFSIDGQSWTAQHNSKEWKQNS